MQSNNSIKITSSLKEILFSFEDAKNNTKQINLLKSVISRIDVNRAESTVYIYCVNHMDNMEFSATEVNTIDDIDVSNNIDLATELSKLLRINPERIVRTPLSASSQSALSTNINTHLQSSTNEFIDIKYFAAGTVTTTFYAVIIEYN